MMDLDALREEIKRIDGAFIDLARRRLALAREIGAVKRAEDLPIRNYAVEAEVIADARRIADEVGVRPELAEEVMKILIAEALHVQEVDRRSSGRRETGTGQRALVVGGRGNMGRWFAEFFDSKGMSVSVADAAGPLEGYSFVADWRGEADAFDVVCVATPPSTVAGVLSSLKGLTDGLVVEIASLKSPFMTELEDLVAGGATVASIHPMWGPATDLLASKNLLVCDCGDPEAVRAARALFEDTAANVVGVPVRAHDALMAFTLGLPHAINLVFNRVLRDAPYAFPDLESLGGPTFTKQVRVAREVAHENKDLYYEIQRLNAHTPEVFAAVREALAGVEAAVGDRAAFIKFMQECETYWGDR